MSLFFARCTNDTEIYIHVIQSKSILVYLPTSKYVYLNVKGDKMHEISNLCQYYICSTVQACTKGVGPNMHGKCYLNCNITENNISTSCRKLNNKQLSVLIVACINLQSTCNRQIITGNFNAHVNMTSF